MRLLNKCSRPVRLSFIGFLFGLLFSLLTLLLPNALDFILPHIRENCVRLIGDRGFNVNLMNENARATNESSNKQLLLVGIMTAAKYVDTRAYNVWKTWAQKIPGKVLFFVSENTVSAYPDMPLIRLKGVDDTYPPQKKSFAMMRWFYDNHLNDFDWFMRADDDLYVRGERLEEFLRSLDAGKAHMIGQAGLGNSAEYGQLALGVQENYCMGGPGVIVSKQTLSMVAPHLQSCLLNLLTTHEDVELGRCIRKAVGVSCSWNYEMQILFHNNQTQANVYEKGGAAELRKAITLHPVKDPAVMRKLHVEAESLKLDSLRARKIRLERELSGTPPSLSRRVANTTNDLQIWEYIASNKITFCANQVVCPRHTIDSNMRTAIGNIVTQLFDEFNMNARQRGRILQFQNIQYGYVRVEPRHGVDYVLDMILWFKKFRLPHRATLSVRRHAYIQQTFGPPQAISERKHREIMHKRAGYENPNASNSAVKDFILQERIHLLMPLKGRAQTFQRFANNLRNILPANENEIELVIICYQSNPEEDAMIRDTVNELTTFMHTRIIEMGDREFSRGQALTAGASSLSSDSLMFFTDVDMIFSFDTLQRIRLNTVLGAQVFFPIVLSEFSSKFWSAADRTDPSHTHFSKQRGYLRHFGYGLVSIYKQDFENIGGFNLSIKGWGLEDVDMFEKCVSSKHLRVFRAPDPGLIHPFHKIECPSDIPVSQRHMCAGSKAASIASLDWFADQFSLFA